MKKMFLAGQICIFASVIFLSGCAQHGYMYDVGSFVPHLASPCTASDAPTQIINLLNERIGQYQGPTSRVTDIKYVVYPGHADIGSAFTSCRATLITDDGQSEDGIVSIIARTESSPAKAEWEPTERRITANFYKKGTPEYCDTRAVIYQIAADGRDQGNDPKIALNQIYSNRFFKTVPEPEVKGIINVVYFDSAFSKARGLAFHDQMLQLCLFGPAKPFQPLKY